MKQFSQEEIKAVNIVVRLLQEAAECSTIDEVFPYAMTLMGMDYAIDDFHATLAKLVSTTEDTEKKIELPINVTPNEIKS